MNSQHLLRTARLLLREADRGDLAALAHGEMPPGQVAAADYPLPGTRTGAALALLDPAELTGFGMYQISELASGEVIGDIGFHGPPAQGRAEVGYGIVASRRRQGYASEALRALTKWALADPRVLLIEASTDADNQASRQVLLAAGFREVADQGGAGPGPWLRYRLAGASDTAG